MSKGVFLIARNNKHIDYVKQSIFLARRIKKYLDVPVTIATDSVKYLESSFGTDDFDKVIELPHVEESNRRYFFDGTLSKKTASFKNANRASVYDLSPYDETLLMDTDYIISNSMLKSVFTSKSNFLIYKESHDIAKVRDESEFNKISDTSIDFYWATVVFFRKTKVAKTFFDCIRHIQHNWSHYRNLYMITNPVFRNDFAFSIAAHIMNGNKKGNFIKPLPGKLFYVTDRDLLVDETEGTFRFLVEKEDQSSYFPVKVSGVNVHIINKFSLNRYIDEQT